MSFSEKSIDLIVES